MLKRMLCGALLALLPACGSVDKPDQPEFEPVQGARVVIIGDAISLGLGAMGADIDCPLSPETSSLEGSFGVRVARALRQEYEMFAWPGIGLVHNYGTDQSITLSTQLEDPDEVRRLEAAKPVSLVLVNIGTHDFHMNDPTDTFIPAMEDLLSMLVTRYPDATLYALTGPMLGGKDNAFHDQAVQTAVDTVNAERGAHIRYLALNGGDRRYAFGCQWHPSLPAHEHMADMILEDLKTAR